MDLTMRLLLRLRSIVQEASQVTVEQHMKEIYYLEAKKLLFKKALTHSNQQLAILGEHFCAKLLSDYIS